MKIFLSLFLLALAADAQTRVGILLRGGTVVDGSGSAPVKMDVGITGDRITFLGDSTAKKVQAGKVIDVTGLIVSPGFIDPHAHALEDLSSPKRHNNANYLMQGVTTVITGNDGAGPINPGAILDTWKTQGIGTNAALLVGFGSVRREVLGLADAAPNQDQLQRMRGIVQKAMTQGALGMSTGLFYSPQNFSKTSEVIELAKVAAAAGGVYDSHMRDESSYSIGLLGSIRETIQIAREAHIAVNISHIKALGADVWGQSKDAIALIREARKEGLKVTADQYPYTASGSSLQASLMPAWAQEGGGKKMIERIDDPAVHDRLRKEVAEAMRRRGGAESFLLLSPHNPDFVGKRLNQVGSDPVEAALSIIHDGGSSVASFNMIEPDIEAFMKEDWVMTCSDGSAGHPRKYGTFPRKLRRYVYERNVISLPFMVKQSSAMPAEVFGIKERGRLKVGYFADVIVFDPATVADTATYEEPEKLATGMNWVFVNGVAAVESGSVTNAITGRPLRR